MSIYTETLNNFTGKTMWELQSENFDSEQEIARSSFADMLHDKERNEKYFDALKKAIDETHSLGKKAKVLDIGTGTGLLSMMAVQCGADVVVACEAFAPMSDCARRIIELNNFGNKIKIVSKHSNSLTVGENGDMSEKANILVAEVFDTELIGEGALSTFNYARRNLLDEDCFVIPDSASIYVQIVESPLAHTWNSIKNLYDFDGQLLIQTPDEIKNCSGVATVHDIQLSQVPISTFREVIPPCVVLHFDWTSKNSEYNRTSVSKVKAKQTGCAQLVFMWWELYMDSRREIVLSCAPYWAHPARETQKHLISSDIPWRDHWMQAIYYLPIEKFLEKNEEVNLISCHDEFSLWFYLEKELKPLNSYNKPLCSCGVHCGHSRTRIGQLNDNIRNKKYLSIIEKYVDSESVVLLMGYGFYPSLSTAKKGAKKVLYLSENSSCFSTVQSFVKSNKLDNVEIIENIDYLKQNKWIGSVSLILAEPYFFSTILPWDGLRFAYIINELKPLLPNKCTYAPFSFSIKCVPVLFTNLQKIKLPLEECFKINMAPFDDLIQEARLNCDEIVEPQPLWEYPCTLQGPVTEIVNFNFEAMFQKIQTKIFKKVEIESSAVSNGIAFWVDWYLDEDQKYVISTGPVDEPQIDKIIKWDIHTRQGVHFLQKPTTKIKCEFFLNILEASYKFKFL